MLIVIGGWLQECNNENPKKVLCMKVYSSLSSFTIYMVVTSELLN